MTTAVVELAWVLSSAYDLDRAQLVAAFEGVLRTKELVIERAEVVWKALRAFQSANADFADCLIAHSAASAGCEKTMTFDRGAAKSARIKLISLRPVIFARSAETKAGAKYKGGWWLHERVLGLSTQLH